jgi:hypothetical protein
LTAANAHLINEDIGGGVVGERHHEHGQIAHRQLNLVRKKRQDTASRRPNVGQGTQRKQVDLRGSRPLVQLVDERQFDRRGLGEDDIAADLKGPAGGQVLDHHTQHPVESRVDAGKSSPELLEEGLLNRGGRVCGRGGPRQE